MWWKNSVFYHIYPRSFLDTTGNGIGDLRGIIQKVPYLKSLGVDVLWLSPIFPSPNHDFGYDISDYCSIDSNMGSMKDIEELIDLLHQHKMRIILDGVFNHTSQLHPWFLASKQNDSSKKDWYIWRDRPNNWTSAFGGSAWSYHKERNSWYLHSFAKEQPDLNWNHPPVREAIYDIMRFWFEKGIDGFRLDVFNCYAKDPLFRNNPRRWDPVGIIAGLGYSFLNQHHIYDRDQPQLLEHLGEMRKIADQYNAVLIGETLDERLRYHRAADYVGAERLHLAFHFQLLHTRWNTRKIYKAIHKLQKDFSETWPSIVLSNHDFPRQSKRWGTAPCRRKLMAFLAMTLKGTPFVYYGEEIGMMECSISKKDIQDPVGKKFWPLFQGRDGARTPMQWSEQSFAGFSTHKPWLPIARDYKTRNVDQQQQQPYSILKFYQEIIALRKAYPCLQQGDIQWQKSPKDILCYIRYDKNQRLCISINLSRTPTALSIEKDSIVYSIGSFSNTQIGPESAIVQKTLHHNVHP